MRSLALTFILTSPLAAQNIQAPVSVAPELPALTVPGVSGLAAPALPGAAAAPAGLTALPALHALSALPSLPAAAPAAGIEAKADAHTIMIRPAAFAARPAAAPRQPVLGGLFSFIGRLSAPEAPAAQAYGTGRAYYDLGGLRASDEPIDAVPAWPDGHRGGLPPVRLARFYPRVVFIQDVFEKPASPQTVDYIDRLLNQGVHVVFLTWRPAKGPQSAETVLAARLKNRRVNPLIVVSYNGGKVSLNSRAQKPVSVIPDTDGLPAPVLETLKAATAKLQAKHKGALKLAERDLSGPENPFIYSVALSADSKVSREVVAREYNELLKKAGVPYKMELDPDEPRALLTSSMPLRFSLARVMQALDLLYQGERLREAPEKFLLLTDAKRSPKFAGSFPKGAYTTVVKDGETIEQALEAVLTDKGLPTVVLKLGKLRSFVDFWEPTHRYSAEDRSDDYVGGGARGGDPKTRELDQKFKMYTGGVIYALMGKFYDNVWRGKWKLTSLSQLLVQVEQAWKDPINNGVPVSKLQARLMQTPEWRAMSRGYMEFAAGFVTNFYQREFANFPAAARDVRDNLVSLSTFHHKKVSLEFVSPFTRRLYKIVTVIPRLMKKTTPDGLVLTAHAYRTGDAGADEGEALFAQILAMAVLRDHGRRGPDGRWHQGAPDGPLLSKIVVQLEYRHFARPWTFSPEQFFSLSEKDVMTQGPIVQQITSTIEKMEADEEFQEHYRIEEEKAHPKDLKKPRKPRAAKSSKAPAARKPKAKAGSRRKG